MKSSLTCIGIVYFSYTVLIVHLDEITELLLKSKENKASKVLKSPFKRPPFYEQTTK